MNITSMEVTPEMAKQWLEYNNNTNRSISPRSVAKYAADIAAGEWVQTHQNAIAFYDDGNIADGQHRLSAIVKTGVTIEMMVATGLPKSAAKAIDQGRARKMSDALMIGGLISGGQYAQQTVAMMNIILAAENPGAGNATTGQMGRAINRMQDGVEFANEALRAAKGRLKAAPIRAALCVGSYAWGYESAERFAEIYISGIPVAPTDRTVITIRNRILTDPVGATGNNARRVSYYKMMLRFMRAYSEGRILQIAKFGDELPYRTGAFDE